MFVDILEKTEFHYEGLFFVGLLFPLGVTSFYCNKINLERVKTTLDIHYRVKC